MRSKYQWMRISLGVSVLVVTLLLTGFPATSQEKALYIRLGGYRCDCSGKR